MLYDFGCKMRFAHPRFTIYPEYWDIRLCLPFLKFRLTKYPLTSPRSSCGGEFFSEIRDTDVRIEKFLELVSSFVLGSLFCINCSCLSSVRR
jgi:hypothetical protein